MMTGSTGDGVSRHGTTVVDEATDRIVEDARHPPSRAELRKAAVNGMLRRLGDRYAHYYGGADREGSQAALGGHYSGVGIWLRNSDRGVRVTRVQPRSPADRGGIRPGDIVVRAGHSRSGAGLATLVGALRGHPGTTVRMAVRRAGRERDITVMRAAIRRRNVTTTRLSDHLLQIRVAAFDRGTGRQVRAIVRRAEPSDGLLLDLRGNPGGLLAEAVRTASAFLSGGEVVSYERRGESPRHYRADRSGDTTSPLVVLVDTGTASAAEVVAGALQDRHRAVIVGSRTYGKGTVQERRRLSDGSGLELTVARYRTPRGRTLDGVGIDPDVLIASGNPPEVARRRAKDVLDGLLAGAP